MHDEQQDIEPIGEQLSTLLATTLNDDHAALIGKALGNSVFRNNTGGARHAAIMLQSMAASAAQTLADQLQEIAPAEVMEEEGEARKKGKHARIEGAANVPKADEEVEDED